jgi:hypothetical protein
MDEPSILNEKLVKHYRFKSFEEEELYFAENIPGRKEEEIYYYENISKWFAPNSQTNKTEFETIITRKNRILNYLYNLYNLFNFSNNKVSSNTEI